MGGAPLISLNLGRPDVVAHMHGGPFLIRTTVPWPPPRHVFVPVQADPTVRTLPLNAPVSAALLEMKRECFEFVKLGTETGRPVAHYAPQVAAATRRLAESVDAAMLRAR